jgi:hypothetical protein
MRRLLIAIPLSALIVLGISVTVAADITDVLERVSPTDEPNATEPSVAVDRADGTVYVAWQATGSHLARSDNGGRTWVQLNEFDPFGRDLGDVHVRIGGPTSAGAHRVYVTALERLPLVLQVKLAYSDDRGKTWTINDVAAVNPSLIDRPWLAVSPGATAATDKVYIAYHDFSASQIWVSASSDGGAHFGPQSDVLAQNGLAFANSFCNTVPSGIDVDPRSAEVYVLWITADPIANTSQGCNISQIENFHQVWMAHSAGIAAGGVTLWDAHLVFDGGADTNTDKIFAALAVDDSGVAGRGGNVYAVFSDNLRGASVFDIWLSRSGDKGVRWTPPVKVNADAGTHFFPWVAAGSTGRIDFIWLASPDFTPTDAELSPWRTVFAQTINATATTPTFRQTAVSGVMHVGDICTNGIFCSVSGGNRDLADSISVVIDRGGAAALVWTDQGTVLHGPTQIQYRCVRAGQPGYAGANTSLACKGPAGP